MTNENEKLLILCEEEGYSDPVQMLEECMNDSTVPAICTNCDATSYMEPDQEKGFCENCGNNSVVSCLVLAGLI
jgi:hypothetical protein